MACSRSIRPTSRAMGLTTDGYPMCSFECIYREFFTLMTPSGMAGEFQWLDSLRCWGIGTLAHSRHLKAQGAHGARRESCGARGEVSTISKSVASDVVV